MQMQIRDLAARVDAQEKRIEALETMLASLTKSRTKRDRERGGEDEE